MWKGTSNLLFGEAVAASVGSPVSPAAFHQAQVRRALGVEGGWMGEDAAVIDLRDPVWEIFNQRQETKNFFSPCLR